MKNENLIKAFEIINMHKDKNHFFHGNMTEELIINAENYLKLKFPKSYREFLLEYGNGFFNGHEFYGICKEDFINSSIPDAIWLTMNERNKFNLDNSLILIKESTEYYFAIDTSRNINGENPVIDLIPGVKKEECEIVADDFGTFFLNEIRKSL
jgi:cell wall assembly regulator SMI1